MLDLLDRIKIKDIEIKLLSFLLGKYTGRKPEKDNGKFWKGLKILLLATTGKVETRSWGYPPIIVAMFFIIILGFLCGGIYNLFEIYQLGNDIISNRNIMYFVALIIILAQIFLWSRFIGKLSDLMGGSATVDGYFWRFMLVRTLFLNRYKITPEFLYADERLEEAIEELGREMGNRSSGQIGI